MRVLHVTSYYWPATEWGGPARSVPRLIEALHEAGIESEVITTTARGSADKQAIPSGRSLVGGVPVVYCSVQGWRRYRFSTSLTREVLRSVSTFDIVHLQALWTYPTMVAALACRRAGIPYVVSPRGTLDRWSLAQKATRKRIFMRAFGDEILKGAALTHYTSAHEVRRLAPQFKGRSHVVVPNPVEMVELLQVPPAESQPVLRLLVLGRIHPKKGFDILIPALALLREKGLRFELTIAGHDEGGYGQEVRRLAERAHVTPAIRFVGHLERPGMIAELAATDVVVLPSYQENFGMAIAEAMAAGRPVVVSDKVALSDDVRDADAGMVVETEPHSLCLALGSMAESAARRQEMGALGREWAARNYSPERVAAQMADAYETLLKTAAGRRQ